MTEQSAKRSGLIGFLLGRRRLSLLQLLLVAIMFPAFFASGSFIGAESPQQAAANGRPLPEGWSGGVMNHGSYYRWYTIADAPVLFGLSLTALAGAVLYLMYVTKKASLNRAKNDYRP